MSWKIKRLTNPQLLTQLSLGSRLISIGYPKVNWSRQAQLCTQINCYKSTQDKWIPNSTQLIQAFWANILYFILKVVWFPSQVDPYKTRYFSDPIFGEKGWSARSLQSIIFVSNFGRKMKVLNFIISVFVEQTCYGSS